MAAAHPLRCARTVDILNAAPEPVRRTIKVKYVIHALFVWKYLIHTTSLTGMEKS
jgi:hypothetical protein